MSVLIVNHDIETTLYTAFLCKKIALNTQITLKRSNVADVVRADE